jgi:NAD(P)-dependent dehydrogenase (short-subunit alcohol dehydrogenase family)
MTSSGSMLAPSARWGAGSGLEGRGLVVTGAASGIGRAMAMEAAAAGAELVLVDRAGDALDRTCDEARALGVAAEVCVADLTDFASYERVVELAAKAADGVGATALFHAAGVIIRREHTMDVTEQDWDTQVAVNMKASWFLTRAFSEFLVTRQQQGSVVLVSSVSASLGLISGSWVYASTKGAVSSMIRGFAKTYGKHGIRINGLAPGLVETPMVRGDVENREISDLIEQNVPLGRTAYPEEIARTGLFLLSDYASYIAGVTLDVDGGWLRR